MVANMMWKIPRLESLPRSLGLQEQGASCANSRYVDALELGLETTNLLQLPVIAGLMTAARLIMCGVSNLIIDQNVRAEDSWQ